MFLTRNLAEALSAEETLARRAVALDGDDAEARSRLAIALQSRGDYQGGQAEAERALVISPNLADAHGALGVVLTFGGDRKKGLRQAGRLPLGRPLSTYMSAGAFCGTGPRTTPTCSKACAKPDCRRSEAAPPRDLWLRLREMSLARNPTKPPPLPGDFLAHFGGFSASFRGAGKPHNSRPHGGEPIEYRRCPHIPKGRRAAPPNLGFLYPIDLKCESLD